LGLRLIAALVFVWIDARLSGRASHFGAYIYPVIGVPIEPLAGGQ